MENVLFIASSQDLTNFQKEGWNQIITLNEVLKSQLNEIGNADLEDVKFLAEQIVLQALQCNATHFYCAGEVRVTLWANLIAQQITVGSSWEQERSTVFMEECPATWEALTCVTVDNGEWREIF